MTENEIVEIKVDTSNVKLALEEVSASFGAMKSLAKEIVAAITKAFLPLQKCLEKIEGNVSTMTSTLTGMASEFERFAKIFEETKTVDQWKEDVSNAFNTVIATIGAMAGVAGVIVAAGIGGAAAGTVAVIAAVITAAVALIIAAIVAVVKHWDEIKQAFTVFFTETIPQLWGQFVEWIQNVAQSIKNFLLPIAEWFNTNVIQPVVGFFTSAMEWISTKLQEGKEFIQTIFNGISEFLKGAFAKDWTEQFGAFGNVLNAFFQNVQNIWTSVEQIFNGIVNFVKDVFAGDWGAAWDSIAEVFKGIWEYLLSCVKAPINGIIGLINGLMSGVVSGINLVIKALNQLHFDIPDWVPGLGGKSFGFNIKTISAPQIPLLAKGAVLPANKPFLAVVGDQKHGTNVEAPLATIQEAVALVMNDHISAMMAGFEALLQEQRAIRQTVEGIELGDSVIGRAAQRYNQKMAIVKGGY